MATRCRPFYSPGDGVGAVLIPRSNPGSHLETLGCRNCGARLQGIALRRRAPEDTRRRIDTGLQPIAQPRVQQQIGLGLVESAPIKLVDVRGALHEETESAGQVVLHAQAALPRELGEPGAQLGMSLPSTVTPRGPMSVPASPPRPTRFPRTAARSGTRCASSFSGQSNAILSHSFERRSSWALIATMRVLSDINPAPSAGDKTMP